MKYYFICFFFLIVFNPINGISNNQIPVDNLTIFDRLTADIVQHVIPQLSVEKPCDILIRSIVPQDYSAWYIESRFIQTLKDAGYKSIALLRNTDDDRSDSFSGESTVVIEFKIIQLNVQYLNEPNFWRDTVIGRKLVAALEIKVYSYDNGSVLWLEKLERYHTDQIKRKHIPIVQNVNLSFTQALTPPLSGFKKFLEPAFVMGLTSVVVYLFYSFRSK